MDSHMLEMASVNKFSKFFRLFYKVFVTPIVKRQNLTVIRTQNDEYVERCLGIPLQQAPWISVGSDLLLFKPDVNVKKTFKEDYGISQDERVILYAGKIDAAKSGLLLAEAFKDKFNGKKSTLIIVSNLETPYGHEVKRILNTSQNNIIYFPAQRYEDLVKFYQVADLAVFPKQCSLSFFDLQACGVPVIFEDNNINCERSFEKNGEVFKQGSVESFREKIQFFLEMSNDLFTQYCQNAMKYVEENYNYLHIAEAYMREIDRSVKEWKKVRKD